MIAVIVSLIVGVTAGALGAVIIATADPDEIERLKREGDEKRGEIDRQENSGRP